MRGLIHTGGWSADAFSSDQPFGGSLLRIFDKPLIYNSISILVEIGIRDILIAAHARTAGRFQEVLGNGHDWGLQFSYGLLNEDVGIVESLALAEEFAGSMNCCLISGDKVFMNTGFADRMKDLHTRRGATVLVKSSRDAQLGSETGLCVLDSTVFGKIRTLETRDTGIHDVLKSYENERRLRYQVLEEDSDGWLHVDSPQSLAQANDMIESIQSAKRKKVGCPEEACWRQGLIDDDQLKALARLSNSREYGSYLLDVLERKI
ncbi:MAG: sugar phosphate nucleotidyltransferase [Gammaproteobacteria bacterium]|nr:sugar phosphate nucleotidyltransferase [Gammaproteobacteria bacterium]